MTIPRFFIDPNYLPNNAEVRKPGCSKQNQMVIADPNLFNQVSRVLRLKPGDRLDCLDGLGNVYLCTLNQFHHKTFSVHIEDVLIPSKKLSSQVTIALPLLKGGRFEWALEKMTELGVSQVIPTIFQRSVVKASPQDQGNETKLSRWQNILKEASEQCERLVLPSITQPTTFPLILEHSAKFSESGSPFQRKIICTERREAILLQKYLCNSNMPLSTLIVIGPEGGLTEVELASAIGANFTAVSLGRQILRSETAAIYALALVASTDVIKE